MQEHALTNVPGGCGQQAELGCLQVVSERPKEAPGCVRMQVWAVGQQHDERPPYLLFDISAGLGHHLEPMQIAIRRIMDQFFRLYMISCTWKT